MTDKELETEANFREALHRLERARELPRQVERRRQREIAAEMLKLTEAVSKH